MPALLPAQANPLIGRGRETAAVLSLIAQPTVRLVTLTGPAGCGKTRLALEVAHAAQAQFTDGVRFVDLSSVRAADRVIAAILEALGIAVHTPTRPELVVLVEAIGTWNALFVMDNLEQVIESAEELGQLISEVPASKFLATSREPLHLRWERQYPVPPLEAPALDVADLAESPAVALFVERARNHRPGWAPAPDDLHAIAELCLGLDCLPLAIELAAARTTVLPPRAMLGRLEQRLTLLRAARRDGPVRHQSLREAIAWSYELLSPDQQAVFRRATLFAGWTLEFAHAVCAPGGDEAETLELLAALVDKNLVRQDPDGSGEPRFSMLETIREFGEAELSAHDELFPTQLLLAECCLRLAEQANAALNGPQQVAWLDRLDVEHENMRHALLWSLQSADTRGIGVRLAAALARFWEVRGHLHEADRWIGLLLPERDRAEPAMRARLCSVAGHLAFLRSEWDRAEALHEESLSVCRAEADRRAIVESLTNLSLVALARAQYARAEAFLVEARELARELGDSGAAGLCLCLLGRSASYRADLSAARHFLEESVALRRLASDGWGTAQSLCDLGDVLSAQGYGADAEVLHGEALRLWQALGDPWGLAYVCESVAMASAANSPRRAIQLIAAATAARERVGIKPLAGRDRQLQRVLRACRQGMDDAAFTELWDDATTLTLAEALAVESSAERVAEPLASSPPRRARLPAGLTAREGEVLRLLAHGQTNREIAETLFIAESTAERHVANIFRKIDVTSRSQATLWAAENGVVQHQR